MSEQLVFEMKSIKGTDIILKPGLARVFFNHKVRKENTKSVVVRLPNLVQVF